MKLALAALAFFAAGALAQPLPMLEFEPPRGFTGSLGRDPSAHVSSGGDAMINIYPFRPLAAPFEAQFRSTRLREVLTPDSQEAKLAGPVEIQALQVPGADAALFARFAEDRAGVIRYRLRVAIASRGAVAIVDYNANGAESYQRHWPAVAALLDSVKVGAGRPTPVEAKQAPKGGGPADGLFLAQTRRFVMRIGGAPGSGDWQVSTRYYLLSKDGRFHRGYGLPSVPGGDLRNFDFAKAEREDAANTGTYTVQGTRVFLQSRSGERMEGTVSSSRLSVENTEFKRSAVKQ